jgi:hypothetical protein
MRKSNREGILAGLDSGVAAADLPASATMTVTVKNTDAAGAVFTASFLGTGRAEP